MNIEKISMHCKTLRWKWSEQCVAPNDFNQSIDLIDSW